MEPNANLSMGLKSEVSIRGMLERKSESKKKELSFNKQTSNLSKTQTRLLNMKSRNTDKRPSSTEENEATFMKLFS